MVSSQVTVTVAIPSIPPRADRLARALATVAAQTRPADAVAVAIDHDHHGAAATRNRALAMVDTDWVAFLDDDDELWPNHLDELLRAAQDADADLVYPCFRCLGPDGRDVVLPASIRSGQPFDAGTLRNRSFIPVTVLVRTELVKSVGGFSYPAAAGRKARYEDWGCWLKLLDAGCRFHHHPVTTWTWWHWGGNTSGRGDRW